MPAVEEADEERAFRFHGNQQRRQLDKCACICESGYVCARVNVCVCRVSGVVQEERMREEFGMASRPQP